MNANNPANNEATDKQIQWNKQAPDKQGRGAAARPGTETTAGKTKEKKGKTKLKKIEEEINLRLS